MNRLTKIALAAIGFFSAANFNAQEAAPAEFHNPPTNVEVLVGSRGVSFQMINDERIKSVPQLGFFSVVDLNSDWGDMQLHDHMIMPKATVDIVKGLKLGAGFHTTGATGIRPTASLIYTYANPEFLLIAMPRVDLSKDANFEGLGIVEYKPAINDKWRLYTRLQGTYVHAMKNDFHARSYIRARAGLSYKEFTFGVGGNFEYYGPTKNNENNIGGFLQVLLF